MWNIYSLPYVVLQNIDYIEYLTFFRLLFYSTDVLYFMLFYFVFLVFFQIYYHYNFMCELSVAVTKKFSRCGMNEVLGGNSFGSSRSSSCHKQCWYTSTLPSLSSFSPPPSPSGMLLPLPKTKTDCSISFTLQRRWLAAILHQSANQQSYFRDTKVCRKDCIWAISSWTQTISDAHLWQEAMGHQVQKLSIQKLLFSVSSQPHKQSQRITLTLIPNTLLCHINAPSPKPTDCTNIYSLCYWYLLCTYWPFLHWPNWICLLLCIYCYCNKKELWFCLQQMVERSSFCIYGTLYQSAVMKRKLSRTWSHWFTTRFMF